MNGLSIFLWLVTAVLATGQVTKEYAEAQWWISPKGSPLQFSSTTERYLDLFNASQETVVSHTLGCAIKTKDGYEISRIFAARRGEMKPRGAFMDPKSWYQETYLLKCKNPADKLAVVEVKFANGKMWTLPLANRQK